MSNHGRSETGLILLLLGDSCSGIPGQPPEANLRKLIDAVVSHTESVDALCYLGDHVAGCTTSESELRAQWQHFLGVEFRPAIDHFERIHHLPSNHTAYDAMSSAVYGEMLAVTGQAGIVSQKGLNYALRDDDRLLVFLNTADPARNGAATLDLEWLDETLANFADVPLKMVFGHHPIHPVNGYRLYPLWRVPPELGEKAWSVMRKAGVSAYICSHILAFDFQVHQGIVQLCSGGGGTVYGPDGLMPAATEYYHFAYFRIRQSAIHCTVYDADRTVREEIAWPFDRQPQTEAVEIRSPVQPFRLAPPPGWAERTADRAPLVLRLSGQVPETGQSATILCGWSNMEAPPILWVGFEGVTPRLVLKAVPLAGAGQQIWQGPIWPAGASFDIELCLYPAAGPGGVLARTVGGEWSSLATSSSRGLNDMAWPDWWAVGHGPEGPDDAPFRGQEPSVGMIAFKPALD